MTAAIALSDTIPLPLKALETVAVETPAFFATSMIVAIYLHPFLL